MTRIKHTLALDLGTTKFCIASINFNNEFSPLMIHEVPSEGMKRGMLVDFSKAKKALNTLLEETESKFKSDIRKVVVGVAGSHLRGRIIEKEMAITDPFIRSLHIDGLTQEVESQNKEPNREMLHCIPVSFQIEDRDPIPNPVGLSGSKLTGRFFIIDADKSYLKDLIRLCNQCGLEVTQLYAEPFASASVTVEDDLKNLGVAIADIGGGTTDGIVFQNGRPVDLFTINTAGNHMNRDISVGLNLPVEDGLRIKEDYGLEEIPDSLDLVSVHGLSIKVRQDQIKSILEARILELGRYMFHSLVAHQGNLGGGIIFTGGGSNLKGVDKFLSKKFGISVVCQNPRILIDEKIIDSPLARHATVIGLLNLEIGRIKSLSLDANSFWARRYLTQFFNWIRELS